jgi:hypothetical protein
LLPETAFNGDDFHTRFFSCLISAAKLQQARDNVSHRFNTLEDNIFEMAPMSPIDRDFRGLLQSLYACFTAIRLPLQPFEPD